MISVPAEILADQLRAVFDAWGMHAHHREVCVEKMLEADLMGIDSHGVGMLPQYEDRRQRGALVVNPEITVVNDFAAVALLDGGHGMGHIAATRAMELAVEKARRFGIGLVSVRSSNHYGAAGVYAEMARGAGLLGLSVTGTQQRAVVPTFGREPRFSTNPLAFSAPGDRSTGFALDMATSTVAVGKLKIAKRADRPIPPGWAVDASGAPETDPVAALAAAPKRLTPLGGSRELGSHKGYGLAMMVEILASVLSGARVGGYDLATDSRGRYIDVGHCLLAVDPALVRGDDGFAAGLDRLVEMLRATPPADPAQPVLVAGDPERAARATRTRDGIPMQETLVEEIRAVARSCGAEFLLG